MAQRVLLGGVVTLLTGAAPPAPPASTQLLVLLPGEVNDPASANGKAAGHPPLSQVDGVAFQVRVLATDPGWTLNPTITNVVHLTCTDGTATIGANATMVAGIATINVTSNAIGSYTITASDVTDPARLSNTSSTLTVTFGAFVKLLVTMPGESRAADTATGKSGSVTAQTAGVACVPTVYACDAKWNVVTTVSDTVSLASSDPTATLPANFALVAGVATCSVTFKTSGTRTITASDYTNPQKTPSTSSSTTVSTGAFTQLLLIVPGLTYAPGTALGYTGTPSGATPNSAFSVTAIAGDAYFNTVTSVTHTVHFASTDGSATLPSNAALVAGTKTFTNGVTFVATQTTVLTLTDVTDGTKTASAQSISCASYAVLTASDFVFLDVIRVPGYYQGATNLGPSSNGFFTAKWVSGQLHVFMTGNSDGTYPSFNTTNEPVIEFIANTTFDGRGAQASRPNVLNQWGAMGSGSFYGDARHCYTADGTEDGNAPHMGGISFLPGSTTLIMWSYYSIYNVSLGNETCWGLTDISGGVGNAVAYGPFYSGAKNIHNSVNGSHLSGQWLTPLPASFAAYGTMMAGSGVTSGNAQSSWGPTGFAFTPPTSATPSGYTSTPLTCNTALCFGGADDAESTTHEVREGNYTPYPAGSSYPTGSGPRDGRWTQMDMDIDGAGQFIDLSDKKGYIVGGVRGQGQVWYQHSNPADPDYHPNGISQGCAPNQGPVAQVYNPRWYIYSPADLLANLAGDASYSKSWVTSMDPQAISGSPFSSPWPSTESISNPGQSANAPYGRTCNGAESAFWFDAANRNLYWCIGYADNIDNNYFIQTPLIYVFHIT